MASWRRASSCHATDIEDKIIPELLPSVVKRNQKAEPKHRREQRSRQNTTKTLMSMAGKRNGRNIFAADVCTHTHTHIHTHTHWQGYAHTLVHSTHTHRQAALNVGHWALLSLKRAETVPNPPLQSGCFRTLREKYSICPPRRPRYFTIRKNPKTVGLFNVHWKDSYLSELSTAASVFCLLERCIEMVGAWRVGEKNRRPTSQYSVQSCAIETVERTIFPSTVAAEKRSEPLSDLKKGNDYVFFIALPDWLLRWQPHLLFD